LTFARSLLYETRGQFDLAEEKYLDVKAIFVNSLGVNSADYASLLLNLSGLYVNKGQFELAENILYETKSIREKIYGKNHEEYYEVLINIAALYAEMNRLSEAEEILLKLTNDYELTEELKHSIQYASMLNQYASVFVQGGNYHHAEKLMRKADSIFEQLIGDRHPDRIIHFRDHAKLLFKIGDYNKFYPIIEQAITLQKENLAEASHYLSESELIAYTNTFLKNFDRYCSYSSFKYPEISGLLGLCFDNSLFYKGFVLSSVNQIRNASSFDSVTLKKHNLLISCERRLAKEYSKPVSSRIGIEELEFEANTLEKELTRTVAGFGEALRQVSWQEVQSALKPNEAAIEFIRYNYYSPEPTDSILYAALLLKPGMESPAFISLFEEKQLQAILTPLAGQGSDGMNELYAGQAGQALYRLLWKPIEPSLRGTKAVYISPAGLLHRLNLSAIPTTQTSTETIGKRHEIYVVGSTRQLVVGSAPTATSSTADAIVFGGIQYEMDSSAIVPTPLEESYHRNRGISFNHTDSTLRGDTWRYLKYSEKEVTNIQSQLQKAGYQEAVYKGFAATEEAFKQIGKDKPAPKIIHLSTHGFFFPDVKNQPKTLRFGSEEPVFKISDNPMIRAGLILAGGNYAWKTGKPLGNREDGILTAYEISQMDLRSTDLVVLSACETGLGQIEGNEGVYGLQRAFKIAGAKHLVMSLWQIPDFHTQELMTAFYSNMLIKKMPVREALMAAQETMRLKRYEPFYWAGFVLVE